MKSWKTTTAGVLTLICALAAAGSAWLDGNPATVPNWEAVIAAGAVAWGLISARDNKVSSEDAGAK